MQRKSNVDIMYFPKGKDAKYIPPPNMLIIPYDTKLWWWSLCKREIKRKKK